MDDAILAMTTHINDCPIPMDDSEERPSDSSSSDVPRPAWQQLATDNAMSSPTEDLGQVLLRRLTASVMEVTFSAVPIAREFFANLRVRHDSILHNLTDQDILVDPANLDFIQN